MSSDIKPDVIDTAMDTLKNACPTWLPIIGRCFNITFDPEEKAAVERALEALRDKR